jgi:hypothetical protein
MEEMSSSHFPHFLISSFPSNTYWCEVWGGIRVYT